MRYQAALRPDPTDNLDSTVFAAQYITTACSGRQLTVDCRLPHGHDSRDVCPHDAAMRASDHRCRGATSCSSLRCLGDPSSTTPSWFVRFGVDAQQSALGRQVLGSVSTHPGVGARRPILLDPCARSAPPQSANTRRLARPARCTARNESGTRRSPPRRRLFGERSLLWGLLLGNIAVVAIGSYLTARLAISLGLPARTALAFAFNPGVIFSTMFDLCDALALAATIGALYAAVTRRRLALACFSAVAGLTKEPAVLALGAAALASGAENSADGRPTFDGKTRMLLIAPAALAIGAWGALRSRTIRLRLGRCCRIRAAVRGSR